MILPRRKFLLGLSSLLAAPAIVRASSLMPVKALLPEVFIGVDPPYDPTSEYRQHILYHGRKIFFDSYCSPNSIYVLPVSDAAEQVAVAHPVMRTKIDLIANHAVDLEKGALLATNPPRRR